MARHAPPSKAVKALKQSLQQLVPRVAGMDSGLDLAVEVAPIDYIHTYKYDMVGREEGWVWLLVGDGRVTVWKEDGAVNVSLPVGQVSWVGCGRVFCRCVVIIVFILIFAGILSSQVNLVMEE